MDGLTRGSSVVPLAAALQQRPLQDGVRAAVGRAWRRAGPGDPAGTGGRGGEGV